MMSAKLEMIGSDGSRCVVNFGLEMRDRPSLDWRTLQNVESAYTFSADGEISNDSLGQNLDEIYELNKDNDLFCEIYKYWKKYHLNDLQAGTQQQTEILKKCPSTDYDDRCKFLKEHDMYVDRGYTYGYKWLVKPIPESVVTDIKKLIVKIRGWS